MSNRSDRTETITDAQFKQIESKLGCKLPPESREHIRSGITWAPLLQRMQTDLKATIFQVADEIAAHAPALERALAKAQESEDISHWLLDFGGVDHGLAQLGIRPKSCIPFTLALLRAFKVSARAIQKMPRRGRGRDKGKDREFLIASLIWALRAVPGWPGSPNVQKFAEAVYAYLPPPAAPSSHRALADALKAALNGGAPKKSSK